MKKQITIVTPSYYSKDFELEMPVTISRELKDSFNEFAKRNSDNYSFKKVETKKMNRNRIVFVVGDTFSSIKSLVIKRIAFANYRPNSNIQTFIYTLDTGCKAVRVSEYKDITDIENGFHDKYLYTQIDLESAEYRRLSSMYYNSEMVRSRFSGMMKDFENVLLCMRAEIAESGFDFYSAGNPVTIEKMSNYTAHEDTEYMYRGQTTSHTELRTKVQYQELALDTIRNWTQLQYYKMYGIEPDIRDDFELLEDINVDWCHSRPLYDTADISDLCVKVSHIDKDTCTSAIFTTTL